MKPSGKKEEKQFCILCQNWKEMTFVKPINLGFAISAFQNNICMKLSTMENNYILKKTYNSNPEKN